MSQTDSGETVTCRKCGQPLPPGESAFGSAATGWEHPFTCPKAHTTPAMRRLRVRFANVPVLSLLTLWRWQVLYGSLVVDYASSRHTAEKRARAFIREGGWTVKKWNATSIERVRASGGPTDD